HDGDDRGKRKPLGDEPDREGADELQDGTARRVVDPGRRGERQRGKNITRNQTAGRRQQDERPVARQRERAHRHGDRGAVDQQRGGIVEQAFALEDGADALRQPELLEHRGGGGGVGRRDDRTERDRGGDRKPGEAPADKRDRGRGEHDRKHRQRDDGQSVAPQLLGRRIERGVEQRRGNEQRQREVRLDPDRGRERQERDAGAGDGKQ